MTDDLYFGGQEFEVLIERGAEQCCEHCRNGDWPGRFRKWLNEVRAEAWDEGWGNCWIYHTSEGLQGEKENPYRPDEK